MEKKTKTLSKLKLNKLSTVELDRRRLNTLRGGSSCACIGCYCTGTSSGVNTGSGPQQSDAVHSSNGGSYN
jgi:natural product precursor